MLDIGIFREDKGGNPELVRESQRRRFADVKLVDLVIEEDTRWRQLTGAVQKLKQHGNTVTYIMGQKYRTKDASVIGDKKPRPPPQEWLDDLPKKLEGVAKTAPDHPLKQFDCGVLTYMKNYLFKTKLPQLQEELLECDKKRDGYLNKIGNIVSEKCVISKDEENNGIVRTWGEQTRAKYNHVHLLRMLEGMNTEMGAKVAGSRGYFLLGDIVRLNYSLVLYGIDFLMKRGYKPVIPPFFMKQSVMSKVAQLEQFDEELYSVTGDKKFDKDGKIIGDKKPRYLIATSEQPICGYHLNQWIQPKDLPLKYAGMSTNFRKEVGSHGKDTLGIFRVHQFDKIEQFVVTSPKEDESWKAFDEMIGTAEDFWKSLGIPYRVVNIVSGKLNNAAALKYDLEGWFPASGAYRELVSCSNCTDYQSRRLGTRYRGTGKEKEFVHMLNATLCATTRGICCIVENYQTEEGIKVPDVLVQYMGGKEFMPFVHKEPPKTKAERNQEKMERKKKEKQKGKK